MLGFLTEAIDRYGIPVTTRTNQVPIGDPLPFYYAGLNVVNLIAGGLWYHTTGDTPDKISVSGLERSGRAIAYFWKKWKKFLVLKSKKAVNLALICGIKSFIFDMNVRNRKIYRGAAVFA